MAQRPYGPIRQGDAAPMPREWKLANHRFIMFLGILVIVAVVLLGSQRYIQDTERSKHFQAVFLTNGQVYFGHMKFKGGDFVELTNIYYLQVNQQLQQGTDSQASDQQPQLSLIKLGEELHGPTDRMVISRDQILFFEDLKDTSRVVQTIRQAGGS